MFLAAPGRCLLSLGPELPVPVFLPHKVKLFSQGNPHFYFLINQIFPVPLAQTRAAGQLPKGRGGLPGRVCLGPRGGSPPLQVGEWALKQEMSRELTRAAPRCAQVLSLRNQSRGLDTRVVTGGWSQVSLPRGPS